MKKIIILLFLTANLINLFSQNKKIVGGESTPIEDVPYQVALTDKTGEQFCGGSIIDSKWILTAAHCVEFEDSVYIKAGVTSLQETGQFIEVKRIIPHSGWNEFTIDNDIALLELVTPLIYSTKVQPIPTVTQQDSVNGLTNHGKNVVVSGWGNQSADSSLFTDTLQAISLSIVSNDTANSSTLYANKITPNMLVAGKKGGNKSACHGDSGGPLVVENGGNKKLAGIVSWGEACGGPENFGGVYVRVSRYEKWINDVKSGNVIADFDANQIYENNTSVVIKETVINNPKNFKWKLTGPQSSVQTTPDFQFTFQDTGKYHLELFTSNSTSSDVITKEFRVMECSLFPEVNQGDITQTIIDGEVFGGNYYAQYYGWSTTIENEIALTKMNFMVDTVHAPDPLSDPKFWIIYSLYVDNNEILSGFLEEVKSGLNSIDLNFDRLISGKVRVEILVNENLVIRSVEEPNNIAKGYSLNWNFQNSNYDTNYTLNSSIGKNIIPAIFFTTCGNALKQSTNTVEKISLNNEFIIGPNPTTGELLIQSIEQNNITAISLYNQIGQLMISQSKPVSRLDMSSYPNGVYYLSITTDKGISNKKVIKK